MRKWKITYTFGIALETCYIVADTSSQALELLYLNHYEMIAFNNFKLIVHDIEEVKMESRYKENL